MFSYELNDKGNCNIKAQENLTRIRRGKAIDLTRFSVLDRDDPEKELVQTKLREGFDSPQEEKAVAAVLGMCVGDAMGHPTEFEPVRYNKITITDMGQGLQGRFRLKPGQWTDDASMGLCLADSLLVRGELDGIDAMLRFESWWHHGYNNAFGHDDTRSNKHSCGLGGNISQAMDRFLTHGESKTQAGDNKTSGNGSIMRLAPVPVYYHRNLPKALEAARASSLTTHQGEEAAECCRLLAHCIVTAINQRERGDKSFLNELGKTFHSSEESVNHLARRQQEGKDVDRDWNWKNPDFRYSPTRSKEMPGYIGSYAMDGLAMALHCVASTSSFRDALIKIVNIRGDADSVGSVVGQIAGALYGIGGDYGIPLEWIQTVQQWDREGDIALKAYKLFHGRTLAPSSSSSSASSSSSTSSSSVTSSVSTSAQSKKRVAEQVEIEEIESDEEQEDRGGLINPNRNCPHAATAIGALDDAQAKELFGQGCAGCESTAENWWCLQCGGVFCSRYVNKHMAEHGALTGHKLAMALTDLNTWCYGCENYVINARINEVYAMVLKAKFGT